MDAVRLLYAADEAGTANRLFSCLGESVFDAPAPAPASRLQQALARLTYRVVRRTTRRTVTAEGPVIQNRFLERTGHPYARSLLATSRRENEALVEGGDPMNGPYMMLIPEVRSAAGIWDKLFFGAVQSRDVQLRFRWETRATWTQAQQGISAGRAVRVKAVAAGTGLSLLLAYDRIVRGGGAAVCEITDRDPSNTAKTNRLLAKLAPLRGWTLGAGGLSARTEDVFAAPPAEPFDVVTAIGILEYLQGHTCETTESRQGLRDEAEENRATDLAQRLSALTAPGGRVIVNSYRPHPCIRILELFGKRFDYRGLRELDTVMAAGGFQRKETVGSGVIYDVAVYGRGAS